jgi:hypothetical protein
VQQEKFPNVLEVKDINSFLYEIEAWTTLQCNFIWIWIEFKFNWKKKFNNWIKIELNSNLIIKNGIQIGEKCIQNLMNMVLKKELINKHKWKDTFPCLFAWGWTKQIPIWNSLMYKNLWSLKLHKLTLMKHHHWN